MLRRLRNMRLLAIALAVTAGAGLGAMRANAIDLGDILKVGGISFLVKQYGSQIDKAINSLVGEKGFSTEYQTKVVPIISMGSGSYIGAVQVAGPTDAVAKVEAVGQLEANFMGKTFRIKPLVPINSASITNIRRIPGVGVTAIIDIKI